MAFFALGVSLQALKLVDGIVNKENLQLVCNQLAENMTSAPAGAYRDALGHKIVQVRSCGALVSVYLSVCLCLHVMVFVDLRLVSTSASAPKKNSLQHLLITHHLSAVRVNVCATTFVGLDRRCARPTATRWSATLAGTWPFWSTVCAVSNLPSLKNRLLRSSCPSWYVRLCAH